MVNLGGNTLPDTLNLEKTLTILHFKVESGDDVRSCVIGTRLEKVGGHVTEFPEVLGNVLIQLEGLGSCSRLVERRLLSLIEKLRVEFLESGNSLFFGLSVEFLELFVELLELEDVIGDGSRVHVCVNMTWLFFT